MKKIIHHLRRQPESYRIHILHLLTLFSAVILFVIWAYLLRASWFTADTELRVNNDLEPFSELKNNVVGEYQIISDTGANPRE